MEGFIFIVLVILVLVDGAAASVMQSIAKAKGSEDRYWAWCFWLPLYGYAMVVALPDLKAQKNQEEMIKLLKQITEQSSTNGEIGLDRQETVEEIAKQLPEL